MTMVCYDVKRLYAACGMDAVRDRAIFPELDRGRQSAACAQNMGPGNRAYEPVRI